MPVRSSITTWVIRAARSAAAGASGTKPGAAKGIGSITPSVISILGGACAAAAEGARGREDADEEIAAEPV